MAFGYSNSTKGALFKGFTPVSLLVEFATFEFATCSLPHNRVRSLYLDAKFKTFRGEVVGAITWHNFV